MIKPKHFTKIQTVFFNENGIDYESLGIPNMDNKELDMAYIDLSKVIYYHPDTNPKQTMLGMSGMHNGGLLINMPIEEFSELLTKTLEG